MGVQESLEETTESAGPGHGGSVGTLTVVSYSCYYCHYFSINFKGMQRKFHLPGCLIKR